MKKRKYKYQLRCIKTVSLDGGSMPILKGEIFEVYSEDPNILEGVEGKSVNPGMSFTIHDSQLDCFEFIGGYLGF